MHTLNLEVLRHYGLMAIVVTLVTYGVDVCLNADPLFAGYLGASIPAILAILAFLIGQSGK